jgi:hypothetical protein
MGSSESSQNCKKKGDLAVREDDASETIELSGGAVVAGVLLAGVAIAGLAYLVTRNDRKTMKAPGRSDRIFRDDFEGDPASYFRDLRK